MLKKEGRLIMLELEKGVMMVNRLWRSITMISPRQLRKNEGKLWTADSMEELDNKLMRTLPLEASDKAACFIFLYTSDTRVPLPLSYRKGKSF